MLSQISITMGHLPSLGSAETLVCIVKKLYKCTSGLFCLNMYLLHFRRHVLGVEHVH